MKVIGQCVWNVGALRWETWRSSCGLRKGGDKTVWIEYPVYSESVTRFPRSVSGRVSHCLLNPLSRVLDTSWWRSSFWLVVHLISNPWIPLSFKPQQTRSSRKVFFGSKFSPLSDRILTVCLYFLGYVGNTPWIPMCVCPEPYRWLFTIVSGSLVRFKFSSWKWGSFLLLHVPL